MTLFNLNRLGIDNETCLKAILALLVVLSHSILGNLIHLGSHSLESLNYFPVGCFFFLSGFGLEMQFLIKKPFNLLKKGTKLLLPFYIALIGWTIFFTTNEINFSTIRNILLLRFFCHMVGMLIHNYFVILSGGLHCCSSVIDFIKTNLRFYVSV